MSLSRHVPLILLAHLATLTSAFFANTTTSGLVFDGRLPAGTKPKAFDSPDTSPYMFDSALGKNLTWSQIITFPKVSKSLFDPNGMEAPFEIALTDEAIFSPGNTTAHPVEITIRRADLSPNVSLPLSTPVGYPDVSGIKTLHFSLQNNPAHALNYSHEYRLVWMENQPFNHEQWQLVTGTIVSQNGTKDPKTLQLLGGDYMTPMFVTKFVDGWHNFGLILDFDNNKTQVYYSMGTDPLVQATPPMSNDMSGGGQYHFGPYKKPTNADMNDGAHGQHSGYQESKIHESIIYSGIFMEDTKKAPISVMSNKVTEGFGNKRTGGTGTGGEKKPNGAAAVAVSQISVVTIGLVAAFVGFCV